MDTLMRTETMDVMEAGALAGFAWWEIGDGGSLVSFGGHRWTPGANEARCNLYPAFLRGRWRRLHPEGVPGWGCLCGFRATAVPVAAGPSGRLPAATWSGTARGVAGVISGWGPVVLEEGMWRSAHARPIALYTSPAATEDPEAWARIRAAGHTYRVPVLRRYEAFLAIGRAAAMPQRAA